MPKHILIQAGHENIRSNCNASLRGSTGAGGEVEVTIAVSNATAELLRKRGVEVSRVDANFNCDPSSVDVDYDLALCVHADMDYPNDQGSGFADFPEPSTDGATAESQRLCKAIQDSFFKEVGITVKSKSNANTRYYYMWECLSAKTPCVLIEMGQIKDAHDKPILQDTKKVATALCNAILKAFNMPIDNCDELRKQVANLQLLLDQANAQIKSLQKQDLIEDNKLRDIVDDIEDVIKS